MANQQQQARHSKLRNGSNGPVSGANSNTLQQINPKGKKSQGRDNSSSLPAANGIPDHHGKQVKPSELSLDLIIPSSIRGAKQSPMSGAHHQANKGGA